MSSPTAPAPAPLGLPGVGPDAGSATGPDATTLPLVARTVAVDAATLPVDLLDLLPAQGSTATNPAAATTAPAPIPTTAWIRRGDGMVAWGEVLRITTAGPDRMRDAAEQWRRVVEHAVFRDEVRAPGTGPVAFGSFSFSPDSAAGGTLVVPRVVVGRRGSMAWVTTLAVGALAPAPDLTPQPPATSPGKVQFDDGALDPAAWRRAVADAVKQIRAGRLDKVVLARDVLARTNEPFDVRWALHRLAAEYHACWTFAVDGMLGATPELLLRSEKGLVMSRVLAGTIRRTGDDDADLAHAALLAHSSKDLEEHEYAVTSLSEALAPFCSSMNVPETPFVLHLPNVLHLATDVAGVLTPDAAGGHPSSLTLADALHPTAAVAGTPTAVACDLITQLERMDRGRYAAPVGWMGADGDGEWALALRSAEVGPDPRELRLFAGCGIVAASDPGAELAESDAKFVPMHFALGSDELPASG